MSRRRRGAANSRQRRSRAAAAHWNPFSGTTNGFLEILRKATLGQPNKKSKQQNKQPAGSPPKNRSREQHKQPAGLLDASCLSKQQRSSTLLAATKGRTLPATTNVGVDECATPATNTGVDGEQAEDAGTLSTGTRLELSALPSITLLTSASERWTGSGPIVAWPTTGPFKTCGRADVNRGLEVCQSLLKRLWRIGSVLKGRRLAATVERLVLTKQQLIEGHDRSIRVHQEAFGAVNKRTPFQTLSKALDLPDSEHS
jgi:hypothetical protein